MVLSLRSSKNTSERFLIFLYFYTEENGLHYNAAVLTPKLLLIYKLGGG